MKGEVMDLNEVAEELQFEAKRVLEMFRASDNSGFCQHSTLNDAQKFENGVKAFVLDVCRRFDRRNHGECRKQASKLIVAIIPGDQMLWMSDVTTYMSSTQAISENWAQSNSYSKLHSCHQTDDGKLEFMAFAANYYNFCSDVVMHRTSRSI